MGTPPLAAVDIPKPREGPPSIEVDPVLSESFRSPEDGAFEPELPCMPIEF